MKNLTNKEVGITTPPPIKVIQFGEGNFLRAFVDYAFQLLNDDGFNAGISVVQPIEKGMVNQLADQDGLYHLFMNGINNGEEIRESKLISNLINFCNPYEDFDSFLKLAHIPELQFIISNTTEAGINYIREDNKDLTPPISFPGKLTLLFYERFKHFNGDPDLGLTVIPCELINYNADTLKSIVNKYIEEWELGDEFQQWINDSFSFHNSLVDRIVPGYPHDTADDLRSQIGYNDQMMVTSEIFFLWVIEGGDELKKMLPFESLDLDIRIVKDMQPFRTRKVRILNGAHTAMVPLSIMHGLTSVQESVEDSFTGEFIRNAIFMEIIETLEMEKSELISFANAVIDRFLNPFIVHNLSSIALNSVSKFKVRVLPSLIQYQKKYNFLPTYLTFAFACLIRFYGKNWNGSGLPVNDHDEVTNIMSNAWKVPKLHETVTMILGNSKLWNCDLTEVPGLTAGVELALTKIETKGVKNGFDEFKAQFTP